MKAEGLDYDQRMEELEKLEYPKPLRDFVYVDLQRLRRPPSRGWARRTSGRSRSRARCSRASARSPTTCRSTTSSAPRACCCATSTASTRCSRQTVPDARQDRHRPRDGAVPARHAAPGRLEPARGVGADARPELPAAGAGRPEHAAAAARRSRRTSRATRRPSPPPSARASSPSCARGRSATTRRRWRLLDSPVRRRRRALDGRAAARRARGAPRRARRPAPRPRGAQPPPHARAAPPTTGASWRVQQMLVDPAGLNDWVAELDVDLAASRAAGEPVLQLLRLGSLV